MEKEKSATLFLFIISSVCELDKACKLGHSPVDVKFCNACVGKWNAVQSLFRWRFKMFPPSLKPKSENCFTSLYEYMNMHGFKIAWLKQRLKGFPCHQFLKRKNRDAPLKAPRLPNARSISSNLGRLARLPSAATEGLEANIRKLTRLTSLTVTFSVEW